MSKVRLYEVSRDGRPYGNVWAEEWKNPRSISERYNECGSEVGQGTKALKARRT